MSIDLDKLTPAESWHPENWDGFTLNFLRSPAGAADLSLIKLARNAFDVMMRRRWSVFCASNGRWAVTWPEANSLHRFCNATGNSYPDPFTAVVEANEWYKTNMDKAN